MKKMIVPLFCTADLDATKAFYLKHLGFSVSVDLPGYAELEQGQGGPRLAFMAPDEGKRKPASGQGLFYCFQVEDADVLHARLVDEGVTIVEAPGDKPWGERSFQAADPNGISLYFGHVLEAAVDSESAAQ